MWIILFILLGVNWSETNEEEDKCFSDDELADEPDNAARRRKSRANYNISALDGVGGVGNGGGGDDNESDTATTTDTEDDELDTDESTLLNAETLKKWGYDHRTLLTNVTHKLDNGCLVKLRPPLTASLFLGVPPTLTFATADEKSSSSSF